MARKSPAAAFDLDRFPEILERFYAVPTGQNTWWDALSAYADLFPNLPMALVGYEGRLEEADAIAHANYDDAFIRSYEEYYYTLNPWADLLMRAPKAPAVLWGHDFVPIENMRRTEFYADWIQPQGDIATGFASTLFREHDRYFLLTANVSPDKLEEAEQAAAAFKLIGPHLQRSFELWRRLEGQSLNQSASVEVLDRLASAVFVVDGQCNVLFENRKARELCRDGRILRSMPDRSLRFVAHENQSALDTHFARLRQQSAPSEPLMVRLRAPGSTSFALFVAPLVKATTDSILSNHGSQCYLIFVIDLSDEPVVKTELLSKALGITWTEALLARALFENKTLSDYADERKISTHTARVQLKSLMQKTETKRQTELMRLLTKMFAVFDLEADR